MIKNLKSKNKEIKNYKLKIIKNWKLKKLKIENQKFKLKKIFKIANCRWTIRIDNKLNINWMCGVEDNFATCWSSNINLC